MDFKAAVKALQEADSAGLQLESLKAQKAMIVALLSAQDLETRDIVSLLGSLSKVTGDIVRQEGLIRKTTVEEDEELAEEAAIRKIFGRGGSGL